MPEQALNLVIGFFGPAMTGVQAYCLRGYSFDPSCSRANAGSFCTDLIRIVKCCFPTPYSPLDWAAVPTALRARRDSGHCHLRSQKYNFHLV